MLFFQINAELSAIFLTLCYITLGGGEIKQKNPRCTIAVQRGNKQGCNIICRGYHQG